MFTQSFIDADSASIPCPIPLGLRLFSAVYGKFRGSVLTGRNFSTCLWKLPKIDHVHSSHVETASKTNMAAMAQISPIEMGLICGGKRRQNAPLFVAPPRRITIQSNSDQRVFRRLHSEAHLHMGASYHPARLHIQKLQGGLLKLDWSSL